MKKLGLIGAVLLVAASPVWARVDIKCMPEDGNTFTVRYAVSDANKVRAFALDIIVNSPNKIISVTDPNAKYWVYPGSIVILNGEVNNVGTPVANPYDPCTLPGETQPGLDHNGITIEMGSLYSPTGDGSSGSPAKTGPLFKFTLGDRPTTHCSCYVTIRENMVRGGVVLTNGSHPDVNAPTNFCLDCLRNGDVARPQEYADWVKYRRPKCWCYQRQCRGDIDGLKQGPYWVSVNDMTIFRTAVGQLDKNVPPGGFCADIDHKTQGPYRVSVNDIIILRKYIGQLVANVPICDKPDVPKGYPAPYTGPYNFWSN